MKHDLIIVGAGLFGAVVGYEATRLGKRVLVIEKRGHIGGNCYTQDMDGIHVHQYGAHIFRTSDKNVWDYIQQFAEFNHFINSPIAKYHGKVYNMPFNMNTFYQIWGLATPKEVLAKINEQRAEIKREPQNLEEKAISLVGRDVYEILVREYTEKQWGRPCKELPVSIIRRLPVRLTYDNNYFNDPYQGIPIGGYTKIFEKMLADCEVLLNTSFKEWRQLVKFDLSKVKVLHTGPIDEYFDYCYGALAYRSLRFEHERYDEIDNLQGVAVVNYTDNTVPYTRTIEHKHFEFGQQPFTVVSKEYSLEWKRGIEPYYPVNDEVNQALYNRYVEHAKVATPNFIFGGRLGTYQYSDMQDTIKAALKCAKVILE